MKSNEESIPAVTPAAPEPAASTPAPAAIAGMPLSPAVVLSLQRTAGNVSVSRLLGGLATPDGMAPRPPGVGVSPLDAQTMQALREQVAGRAETATTSTNMAFGGEAMHDAPNLADGHGATVDSGANAPAAEHAATADAVAGRADDGGNAPARGERNHFDSDGGNAAARGETNHAGADGNNAPARGEMNHAGADGGNQPARGEMNHADVDGGNQPAAGGPVGRAAPADTAAAPAANTPGPPGARGHGRGAGRGGAQRGHGEAPSTPAPAPVTTGSPETAPPGGGDLDLIDTELAEHERWAGSFGDVGTAGSDQRVRFLLDQAGQGAAGGAISGLGMGFLMSGIGAAVGQVAGRRLASLAVSRGVAATPVPGLGSAIGGVMAIYGLATRDWGATGETIGRIGTGTGYERLANDLEALAEILDVAMSIMDVLAGVLGGIAVGMWVAAVLSAGVLSPLAGILSTIAIGMGIATSAVGMIINVVVRPVVTALRALHTFESQADPAHVEAEGQMLQSAAGQVTGALAGALAAKAGGRAGEAAGTHADRGITALQARATGGSPSMSAGGGSGPRLHVEVPEAPEPGTALPHAPADAAQGAAPHTPTDGPVPSAPHVPDENAPSSAAKPEHDFSDFDDLVRDLEADENVQRRLTDTREPLQPRSEAWEPGEAREYANEQAARHREAQGMEGAEVQAGHTAAARHAGEARISEADWDRQQMMDLHSRRDPDLRVTMTDADGDSSTRTRHTGQERLINDAVDRVRDAQGGLTPRGMLDAADEVKWRAENTPWDQRNIDAPDGAPAGPGWRREDGSFATNRSEQAFLPIREGGLAAPEPGPPVDPKTGRVIVPEASSPTAAAAAPASHMQTHAGPDRAAAMAQYHEQVRADPTRESSVWRDSAGNYYVMQGDQGRAGRPSAAGPLELVYHSHPTSADAATQGLNSQPSQAGGDLGVLQHQHGQGPAGRRQTSELHFPVYDESGRHVGYGTTNFAYDPTHPLPLKVHTTSPGGETTVQRYGSFADFQQRTGIGESGPAGTRAHADARLSADRAAAQARIDDVTRELRPGPGAVGVREGREHSRHGDHEDEHRPQLGPAYTAAVAGPRPGETVMVPVNPPYAQPPGTSAELAALRERIAAARETQAQLAGTETAMRSQATTQRAHDAQLGDAANVTRGLAAGRAAHGAATAATESANTQQQSGAGDAVSTLGQAAQSAGATATLTVSLRAFQGMAGLFSYLPGDLGRSAQGASRDASRLIAALDRVRALDATRGQVDAQRPAIDADRQRITQVAAQGSATDAELASGDRGVAELRARNQDRLAETEATREQAAGERAAASEHEQEAQGTHDELLARMAEWAAEHRATRARAVSEARERLAAQGYRAQEGT